MYARGGDPGALTFRPVLCFFPQSGDKSLAFVIAHEISHSWTGNLVTNRCQTFGVPHREFFACVLVRGRPPTSILVCWRMPANVSILSTFWSRAGSSTLRLLRRAWRLVRDERSPRVKKFRRILLVLKAFVGVNGGDRTWEHFWLNEGWTMWLERNIMTTVSAKCLQLVRGSPCVYVGFLFYLHFFFFFML